MNKLTELQKNILNFLQQDIPAKEHPYSEIALENNVDEKTIVSQIKLLKNIGYIRRFGAILAHHKVGLKANCMCVWIVPENKVKKIADRVKKIAQISHCYSRKTTKKWPYNFYTMIHGQTKKQCFEVIEFLAKTAKLNDYRVLFTEKQFKKTSPKYRV
ncbi:MAG: Lrp/AsnC family transcriptional regulator [Candidatus Omnitrophica bacterium]|nr:Lrp/AsnC family transcriptional regulator [Candidatus Omnitrophota bacterium]